jgi:hypothetical protein
MSFNTLIAYLVVAASTALGSFIVACGLDILAGMVLALRQGKFDWNKLPSWLGAQFATKEFLGVLGLGATAGMTAFASTIVSGGLTEAALQGIAQAALAAATAGAVMMMASVLSDAFSKVGQVFGAAPPPLPLPAPPVAVTIVTPLGPAGDPTPVAQPVPAAHVETGQVPA